MNILLVMPKALSRSSGYDVFPIGIAYVSAAVKQAGFRVLTCNLDFAPGSTEAALRQILDREGIDVVCTSGLSRDYPKLKGLVQALRAIDPSLPIVVGGGIMTSDPETALPVLGVDIGVVGEGETTLCELLGAMEAGRPLEAVPGLALPDGRGGVLLTPARGEAPDLDRIPMPDYEAFDFPRWISTISHTAFLVASRSCPYACTFCFHPSGQKYRQRSLDHLFQEIAFLAREFHPWHFAISDELFSFRRERVLEFCERIPEFGITWSAQLRVSDVDRELLKAMRRAGCISLSYGLESADDRVLKSMRKHTKVAQIERALALTREAEIDIQGGFIFGDVAETLETAEHTLAWNAAHPEYGAELNMIQVFPGTPLYHHARREGIIADPADFLIRGCPLVNVSTLGQDDFNALASRVYETNMRAKHQPDDYRIAEIQPPRRATIQAVCSTCGAESAFEGDALFIQRVHCPRCRQRYYLDPFSKLSIRISEIENHFEATEPVAIWGAGEICIQLLDHYPVLKEERFHLVDASPSRQGLSLCAKPIAAPELISRMGIRTVIIAAINHGEAIQESLREAFPGVTRVLLPDLQIAGKDAVPVLREVRMPDAIAGEMGPG